MIKHDQENINKMLFRSSLGKILPFIPGTSHLAAAHGPKCHQTGEDRCSEAMLQGTQDAAILQPVMEALWVFSSTCT
jgi:hypothetical protein